ncbi:SLC13 family permease [Nocardioides lianchengensis]|uniref:Arsenical pump membrane protein n=1 Tax=Nocardioides lianchengensis TaxID=1045774 RepID=A0A1G6V4H5_9ACTN|nr:SLC13 family permease [Nocardioides lianchengensis]NYG11132.1 arsenical pump membrane protein [Nocardioides lianchengensis]SDD48374.1 arsenical pump membrane protein [Nocardioides lianchengensis]
MPPSVDLLQQVVPLVALAALLTTAYRHPRARVETAVAVLAAAVVLAAGAVPLGDAWDAVEHLAPVVLFLVTILVVAEVCARAGVFAAAAYAVRRTAGDRPVRLLAGTFVLAALVTTVLSLDATVVLLAPVAVAAAAALGTSTRPVAHACLRMANSASLLLPVSNLTNLLALPDLDLSFHEFAVAMAPVLAAVLVVEYVGLRLLFRRELAGPTTPDVPERPAVEPVPLVVVGLMLAAFGLLSPLGVEPGWVSTVAAAVLVAWAGRRGLIGVRATASAAHPSFAVFVLGLGVVVAGVADGVVGDVVADLLPGGTGFAGLLAVAVLATVLANLLTNLSATLLVVPLVAPLGPEAVLAALLGLNIGSGLTYSGSLANLLWRRTLARTGAAPGLRDLHRVSLALTPVSLLVAVAMLSWTY